MDPIVNNTRYSYLSEYRKVHKQKMSWGGEKE